MEAFLISNSIYVNEVMKLKIGNLPNSHLDAKFEDFLCTPNKYLQITIIC